MFTRAGASLAVGLGEVRQPNAGTAQCLRAANLAGAILAGYFPHLRGAFNFPPHLAGARHFSDASQCIATHEKSQIASLLPVKEQPEETVLSSKMNDVEAVRTSVVETLMAREYGTLAREYGTKMNRLEHRCIALYAANRQLQWNAQEAQERSDKTRELNRRLCREVNEARTERTNALEELDLLKQQAHKAQAELKRVRAENATLSEALQASQHEVFELSRSMSVLSAKHGGETFQDMSASRQEEHPGEQGPDPNLFVVPMSCEPDRIDCGTSKSTTVCSCSRSGSWGCELHCIYSGNLLLAHRDIASRICHGPPGLEIEAPPGLVCDPDKVHPTASSLKLVLAR